MSAKCEAWVMKKMIYRMLHKGRMPEFMLNWLKKRPDDEQMYYTKMMDMFGIGNTRMAFVKRESIRNQFYSDLITPIKTGVSVPDTVVHVFYVVKMGEKYLKRYREHFKDPDIRYHEMQHEELLVGYPEQWIMEVKKCCGMMEYSNENI